MIICSESTDSSNVDFKTLLLSKEVKYVVSAESRSLKRLLLHQRKELIRLDDCFNAQKQNKDYYEY